ncbi:MAG: type I phosphomannose isomerase catalytic subunit [Chloroflexota bacterium]
MTTKKQVLSHQIPLYPLRFEPIYQYRLWGGRRLANLLTSPLPGADPIGEAWLLSDRDDHPSLVADGPLKGRTIAQLLNESPEHMLGKLARHFRRFPLLLKFLDARDVLSVQVHPSDQQKNYIPVGESGKTEAWVVLEGGSKSRIYAGLTPDTTPENLRQAITNGTITDHLASFRPEIGDGIFIPAGTVHSLGDLVVFEVQENSDVTYRLYDWNHIDDKTGKPRPLQVESAMACIDFAQGVVSAVLPVVEVEKPVLRERLFLSEYFGLWRNTGEKAFTVGAAGIPRVLVCIAGDGQLEYGGTHYAFSKGDVLLLPAIVGACLCQPRGLMNLLEISLPEGVITP